MVDWWTFDEAAGPIANDIAGFNNIGVHMNSPSVIAGKVKAWAKALTGPTSLPGKYPQLMNAPGSETGPGAQLVTWGKSTVCSAEAFGFKFQWTTNSSKHIPFDWTGP